VCDAGGAEHQPPYLQYLARLSAAWPDIPQLRITYSNLSVTFPRPVGQKADEPNSCSHSQANGTEAQSPAAAAVAQNAGASSRNAKKGHYTIPTLANQLAYWSKLPLELAARRLGLMTEPRRYALQQVSGVIEPGTMTLVLAPPGHG
jgi:hypothetical protein